MRPLEPAARGFAHQWPFPFLFSPWGFFFARRARGKHTRPYDFMMYHETRALLRRCNRPTGCFTLCVHGQRELSSWSPLADFNPCPGRGLDGVEGQCGLGGKA